MAVYCGHNDVPMYMRVSTNPEDISSFGAEQTINPGGTMYTYPTVVQLASEGGAIYLFYRDLTGDDTATLCYVKSTNGGSTWSSQVPVYSVAHKSSYWIIRSDGNSRIDFLVSDGHPLIETPGLYHFYYQGGAYYKTNGASAGSPVFGTANMTQIDNGFTGPCQPWDISSTGLAVLYTVFVNPATDMRCFYANWNGSAWVKSQIVASGGDPMYDPSSPGMIVQPGSCFEPGSSTVVYTSSSETGHWGISRRSFSGSSWASQALTPGSSVPNIYPTQVYKRSVGPKMMWFAGMYNNYADYSVCTMAYD
jgi:hypothetical protein